MCDLSWAHSLCRTGDIIHGDGLTDDDSVSLWVIWPWASWMLNPHPGGRARHSLSLLPDVFMLRTQNSSCPQPRAAVPWSTWCVSSGCFPWVMVVAFLEPWIKGERQGAECLPSNPVHVHIAPCSPRSRCALESTQQQQSHDARSHPLLDRTYCASVMTAALVTNSTGRREILTIQKTGLEPPHPISSEILSLKHLQVKCLRWSQSYTF